MNLFTYFLQRIYNTNIHNTHIIIYYSKYGDFLLLFDCKEYFMTYLNMYLLAFYLKVFYLNLLILEFEKSIEWWQTKYYGV